MKKGHSVWNGLNSSFTVQIVQRAIKKQSIVNLHLSLLFDRNQLVLVSTIIWGIQDVLITTVFFVSGLEATGDPAFSMFNLSLKEDWVNNKKFCHRLSDEETLDEEGKQEAQNRLGKLVFHTLLTILGASTYKNFITVTL